MTNLEMGPPFTNIWYILEIGKHSQMKHFLHVLINNLYCGHDKVVNLSFSVYFFDKPCGAGLGMSSDK